AAADSDVGELERSAERYELGFEAALASRHDLAALSAAVAMIYLYGVVRRESKQGLRWASRADALQHRVGGNLRLGLQLLTNRASTYSMGGDEARARASYDEALALAREAGDEMYVATIINNLGALYGEGRH